LPAKILGVNPPAWRWTQKVGTGQGGQGLWTCEQCELNFKFPIPEETTLTGYAKRPNDVF